MKNISFSDLVKFHPKQEEALQASKKYQYLLYGGSKGAGKSYFLRWTCVYYLLYLASKYNITGINVGLFCEDYPALWDRHLKKIDEEFPEWLGTYNAQHKDFKLAPHFGGGIISFRNLDEPSKYDSAEFAVVAVDEVNRNPYSTFTVLRRVMRWKGIPETKFISACNPVGEPWVRNFWIKGIFPEEEAQKDQFFYVKALPTDNPHLPPEYFNQLRSLPEQERKAFLDGNWDAFESEMDTKGYMRLLNNLQLENAQINTTSHFGVKVLGIDAGAGVDETTMVLRSDIMGEILFNQKLSDTMQIIPIALKFARENQVDHICLDSTGLGKPILDRFSEVRFLAITGVNFASKAHDSERFSNIKAENMWKARDWVLKGGKLKRSQAWNQLETVKYQMIDEKKIKIQPKEELIKTGFPSYNVADALSLTFSVDSEMIMRRKLYSQIEDQPITEDFSFI